MRIVITTDRDGKMVAWVDDVPDTRVKVMIDLGGDRRRLPLSYQPVAVANTFHSLEIDKAQGTLPGLE